MYKHVFSDQERAWLWWVDQRPEKLHVLPDSMFGKVLAELEEARAAPAAATEVEQDSFASVISDFINRSTPEHSAFAIGILRQYLNHFNEVPLVERVDDLERALDRRRGESDEVNASEVNEVGQ